MSDVWTQSEGQIVDNKFRLQKYLAGTEHSAVFLTELAAPQSKKAAIKFIAADPATADRQLSAWARASKLSHSHLLKMFQYGRCRLQRMDLLYVVLEYAEEDLSLVLPERALTASETREMLGPLLEALSYIHEKGFAHSHITPANILAAADQLKLATDTIIPIGATRPSSRKPDIYDAPETESSPFSTSADIWSLGATLVEVLTQHPPVLPLDSQSNPTFPDTLPQPFLDIACHALRRDSKRRWTTGEIAAGLKQTIAAAGKTQSPTAVLPSAGSPAAAAAAASSASAASPSPGHATTASDSTTTPVTAGPAAVSPLAIPVSNVPAVPAARLPMPSYPMTSQKVPLRPQPARLTATAPKQAVVLPNYVVPVVAAVLVIVAIFILPKILGRRPDSSSSAASAHASPASQPKPAPQSATAEAQPQPKSATPTARKIIPGKRPSEKSVPSRTTAPAVAALRTDTFASANTPNSSKDSSERGDVLDQVLPDVSEKARATIRGRVRVGVRAHVDAAGNVSNAELDSPGPSRYFADLGLKAVRRWEFTPPEINGRSVPSEWLIRFEISPSGTKAFPKQIAP
ncbi:MAG TPA: TonB family protein [Candidatus Acidoferrum sp.]|jgi:TonB family protein|nr:TonB family protein [Candidatus Acidoferrum sp.]